MPENRTVFEDLPILSELREQLSDAFTARETSTGARASRAAHRSLRNRLLAGARVPTRPLALSGVGAGIAAAAIAAVLLASPATQPAYALVQNPDGSITVTIHDLETAVPALNARFAAMGIEETVVPVVANCPTSNAPSTLQSPLFADPQATTSETLTLSPGGKWLAPGFTGVLAAEPLPNGEIALAVAAIKPPVPSCFPTTAYTMQQTGTTTNGNPIYQATPVNPTASTTTPSTTTTATTGS